MYGSLISNVHDSLMPPDQRTSYRCDKSATGPLNRKQLIDHINEQAMTEPDRPELVPYEPGTIRGKKWVPPPPPAEEQRADEQVALDMGDEYESALADATESEMVDLAGETHSHREVIMKVFPLCDAFQPVKNVFF
ncbi:Tropomodulin-3 [Amphibalanus amphitrite]|uniref:Tropomodulin-3 n=1 Tax=Amphibalanus amphitrite TaxID=1232801 RepID=A0A6A4WXG1_AMPAM|nr:Tropomodulin-3 [Amphibalanus amphitrite]